MTFALGLASVSVLNGSLQLSNDIPVVLPETQTESPITVFPIYERELGCGIIYCTSERRKFLEKN